jgi:uncharacterized membrane protein YfcA
MAPDYVLIGIGAFVGGLVGLTGVGGGSLMTPILIAGLHVAPVVAIATDLLFAAFTKIAAGAVHFRGNQVDTQVLKRLWWGSLPATVLVAGLVAFGIRPSFDGWLIAALAFMILFSGASLLFGKRIQQLRRRARIDEPKRFKRFQPQLTVAAGVLLGGVVGLTSIGAGAIGAVMLRALYPLRMTPVKLVATDTVHAIPVALLAGGVFAQAGQTDWTMLGMLLLGSIPAAIGASLLAARVNANILRVVLGGMLLLAGAKMLLGPTA